MSSSIRYQLLLIGALLLLPAAAPAEAPRAERRPATAVGERDGVTIYRRQFLSPVYEIDRIYRSMVGPMSTDGLVIDDSAPGEILWIIGLRSTMVTPEDTELSTEFMCHTNVAFTPQERNRYRQAFPSNLDLNTGRLFTLSQGQLEVTLPDGYGIPILSDHAILLNTQVLNLNIQDADIEVRHRVDVDFVRNRDLDKPLIPLLPIGAQVVALVEGDDGYIGMDADAANAAEHGEGCSLGTPVVENEIDLFDDGKGRRFTGHWVVPPGREVRHTPVTASLSLPYDTTAHFIAVHLHPFAESLELRDLTTGESVYKSGALGRSDQVGLLAVETFSSPEGIPLYKDHRYELVSVYDNTSSEEQDAMATMLLYVRANDLYDFYFRKDKKGY